MSRFDYVKYDDRAMKDQENAKHLVARLEQTINAVESKEAGRAKSLALTKLEECYMWIGKAVRDDQIARNGTASLQEERRNS
jgi:hypothetical protein